MQDASRTPIPATVLGATGAVGQRLVSLLCRHPWFSLNGLAASPRSAGRAYGEAVRWSLTDPLPPEAAKLEVRPADELPRTDLVFSALDAEVAGPIETALGRAGKLVITNAGCHRLDADVPLVVPEVNPGHLDLVSVECGGIVANPNCSTIGLALALAPLQRAFGVAQAQVVSLQALSGAGLPGASTRAVLDNVIPWIEGEEEKLVEETPKILGGLEAHGIRPAALTLSAQCNRVPVSDGHLLCVSASLEREASERELLAAWEGFRGAPQELSLPSAPPRPVRVHMESDHPQPRLHREQDGGMSVHVGRLRPCQLEDWRFVVLVHNTLRGAAGGAVLLAELCVARGLLAAP